MVHKYDTERAVRLLNQYQESLTRPEEQGLRSSVGKVSAIFGSQLFQALLDIQECYEVTLKLNASAEHGEATDTKKPDLEKDWQKDETEGASLVQVTCRSCPQKVERVCGVVSLSHVETPKRMAAVTLPPVSVFLPPSANEPFLLLTATVPFLMHRVHLLSVTSSFICVPYTSPSAPLSPVPSNCPP
ncbi:hypothetical protein GJAV_G00200990 [Gymnothorax javanicus]|nr:hypothetical protein GJAV_G00200990 [Gymnothorax javanicus]